MRSPFDLGAKQMKDISLRILDMECAVCVARLDRALEKLPGVQRAAVNYTAASVFLSALLLDAAEEALLNICAHTQNCDPVVVLGVASRNAGSMIVSIANSAPVLPMACRVKR